MNVEALARVYAAGYVGGGPNAYSPDERRRNGEAAVKHFNTVLDDLFATRKGVR